MAQRGELIEWNDERGFGFIRPEGSNERLFVHISQIASRPLVGDRVSFTLGQGRNGGPAAVFVTIAGVNPVKAQFPARASKPASAPKWHHLVRCHVAAFLAILILVGTIIEAVPVVLLVAYSAMGVVSAAFYYNDKRQAEAGRWRTSEDMLHALDLAFGIIGGLLAQQIFRHKTAKPKFAIITYALAALHGLWLAGVVSGRISLAELAALIAR